MSEATYPTWDGDPANNIAPHRPSVEDLGSDDLENDTPRPDPRFSPTADSHNQKAGSVAGLNRLTFAAKITIRFSGTTPFVQNVAAMGSGIDADTFTPARNAQGDVSITWPAGTFPPHMVDHVAWAAGTSPAMVAVEMITNGARVRTADAGGLEDTWFVLGIS